MSGGPTKFRVSFGQLELEYEGSESFLKNDLADLLDKMRSSLEDFGETLGPDSSSGMGQDPSSTDGSRQVDFSTETIASRINAESGPDLAVAAAAHLTLVRKQDTFTRAEILAQMQGATPYYKTTMSSNLTSSLTSLVKAQRINKTSSGAYALTAKEKASLEGLLAQGQ